jgi:F-type H+-transporting ATPase subunit epsilon
MQPDSIQLVIVTPVRQLLSESVVEAQLPGADGYLGILPGHAPLITELGIGELTYRTASGESGLLAVIRGFAEVLPDRISVLAELAERAEEIDLKRAQEALKRAQELIARGGENVDWDRASAALQRALV